MPKRKLKRAKTVTKRINRRRKRRPRQASLPPPPLTISGRLKRFNAGDRSDQRNEYQRDRDRLLYCSALRRLAEVTQVVSAAEGHSFHNRLTHSLKVAQIARRLAEKLAVDQPEAVEAIGGVEPEVAEAAALAHDLGHPPFGHIAEEELNRLTTSEEDGFEGNAQSFRIVTRLAIRTSTYEGLNLTVATLNGILKYPNQRRHKGKHKRKWGVYPSELDVFDWARKEAGLPELRRSVEAELMDWADDIAYSVFDLDDFYRAGLIPLDRLFADQDEQERFLEAAAQRLRRLEKDPEPIVKAFSDLVKHYPPRRLGGAYEGTTDQRAFLREWTSQLVARFIGAIRLNVPGTNSEERYVEITRNVKDEVDILKQLVWHYVIDNPRLLTQQQGQRVVIKRLFEFYNDEAKDQRFDIFPEPYRKKLKRCSAGDDGRNERVRTVVDMIAAMTESQAIRLHNRLSGVSIGSIHDHL